MKYAIFLLLGVSAWGQTPQQMKEQFPPMPPACVEEKDHGWKSIPCQSSQNAPLAPRNQSLTVLPMSPQLHFTRNGGKDIMVCDRSEHGYKNCKLSEGYTLDDIVTGLMEASSQMSEYQEQQMEYVRRSLADIRQKFDPPSKPVAKKKAVSK